jgi:hypothetical protein
MTVIIITPPATPWVLATADLLRERGLKVVCLGTLSIIGFLLMSERVTAVLVHENSLPDNWEDMRDRMRRIAPATKIVVVPRSGRSPSMLAASVTPDAA